MRYIVRWLPRAEADLAGVWTAASDRNAVTRAAMKIDRSLTAAAPAVGESRSGALRITFESPLAVVFQVIGDDVEVLQVRSY